MGKKTINCWGIFQIWHSSFSYKTMYSKEWNKCWINNSHVCTNSSFMPVISWLLFLWFPPSLWNHTVGGFHIHSCRSVPSTNHTSTKRRPCFHLMPLLMQQEWIQEEGAHQQHLFYGSSQSKCLCRVPWRSVHRPRSSPALGLQTAPGAAGCTWRRHVQFTTCTLLNDAFLEGGKYFYFFRERLFNWR